MRSILMMIQFVKFKRIATLVLELQQRTTKNNVKERGQEDQQLMVRALVSILYGLPVQLRKGFMCHNAQLLKSQ